MTDDQGITIETLRWFARGRCLARDVETGETGLVDGAIPGERLRAVPGVLRGARWRATTVLDGSPDRVEPACRHAGLCTGCSMLHVSVGAEFRAKAQTVSEVLARYGSISVPATHVEMIVNVSESSRGDHRTRTRVRIACRDGTLVVGFGGALGELVHVVDCPAVRPSLRDALSAIAAVEVPSMAPTGDDPAVIEITEGASGVALVSEGAFAGVVCRHIELSTNIVAIGARDGKRTTLLRGAWPRQRAVGDIELDVGVDAWTQPCPERAAALYAWVVGLGDWRGARVLDATCGTGGLALTIARMAEHVTGVDAGWEAVQSAMRSAHAAGAANTTWRGGRIETVAPRMVRDGERFDHVVINPMRRSLGAPAMAAIAALGARRVVYLAPAPRAGAEDMAVLLACGYTVRRVGACDLHPGTGHVMACVELVVGG